LSASIDGAAGLSPGEAAKQPVKPVPGASENKPSPDVYVVPVACIGKVPAVVRNVVRNQVKKGSPDCPVWMDCSETMKSMLGLTAGKPNVAVIDAWGRLRYQTAGELNAEQYGKLVQTIDALRAEAAAAVAPRQ
jgi:hypothetical protein